MAAVEIRKVDDPRSYQQFVEFPWTLYRNDPHWVPVLLSMRRDTLDRKKNPAWDYLEGEYFGAWRGNRLVGTIAAFINHRHNEFHDERIGWFGAFDVYDDEEAARALLDTAADWVRARGYSAIRGPQTFTTHEECGLLVDGFTQPTLLMPYNYPYYQRLVEGAGFSKVMDVYSFSITREDVVQNATTERMRRITEKAMQRNRITIRNVDRKRLKAEFELFKELYNVAWEANWGFVPMTPRELDALVEGLGTFFDPDFAFFAEVDGDPAGFILGIPDFNQVLRRANPRPGMPEFITMLRALYYWKINPVMDTIRIPLMGVKAEYRAKGVNAGLYRAVLDAVFKSNHIYHADGGWILETNHDMVSIALNSGAHIYKTHRFYERKW